jgi:hypothetical protein
MSQLGYGSGDPLAVPFDYKVPLTGFSISPQSNKLVLNPAGTLATGTVLLPLNPLDGQTLRVVSTQTQTAITFTANTGDSIVGSITALVANTPVEYSYTLYGTGNSINPGTNPRTWVRTQ